jgi:hypothetical protein
MILPVPESIALSKTSVAVRTAPATTLKHFAQFFFDGDNDYDGEKKRGGKEILFRPDDLIYCCYFLALITA